MTGCYDTSIIGTCTFGTIGSSEGALIQAYQLIDFEHCIY